MHSRSTYPEFSTVSHKGSKWANVHFHHMIFVFCSPKTLSKHKSSESSKVDTSNSQNGMPASSKSSAHPDPCHFPAKNMDMITEESWKAGTFWVKIEGNSLIQTSSEKSVVCKPFLTISMVHKIIFYANAVLVERVDRVDTLGQKSAICPKIHILESHFWQNSHFQSLIFPQN